MRLRALGLELSPPYEDILLMAYLLNPNRGKYELTEMAFDALLAAAELPPVAALPPIEPEAIARELGLEKLQAVRDFSRVRRDFAFRNHPDRVAPHLRERAIQRMQVANVLIDEAKRRALAKVRS